MNTELLRTILLYVPLVVGIFIVCSPFLSQISTRLNAGMSATALIIFNRYVNEEERGLVRRQKLLRASRNHELYRVYSSKTLLYATLVSFGAIMIGPYVVGALLFILELPQEAVVSVAPEQLAEPIGSVLELEFGVLEIFILALLSTGTFGAGGWSLTYWYRWYTLEQQSDVREALIEESIPRTVGFLFALSRSGMPAEQVVEIMVKNRQFFGEAAEEFVVAHREISLMNADFVTAVRHLARTSPSDEFSNLAEDLTNVMKTGRSLPEFLKEKYEQYQEEKERRQNRILEQVSALAEAYVALLVAGPLFLITILIIIGLLLDGTLQILNLFVYFLFPVTSLGFLYYVGKLTSKLGIDLTIDDFSTALESASGMEGSDDPLDTDETTAASTDGGIRMGSQSKLKQLEAYNDISHIRESFAYPVYTVTKNPVLVLYALLPVALIYLIVQIILASRGGGLTIRTVDDYFIQGALVVMTGFAIVQHLHDRELDEIERALPDFLERIADMTGAGMTLAESIQELDPESVPSMSAQITRLSQDIRWGASVSDALGRMAEDTRSVLVSRAVVLIINAKNASNQISPVLRIAAEEAQLDRSLDKRRREEMLIYRMIIYLSFFVFVGIVLALILLFIPAIPSEVTTPSVGGGSGTGAPGIGGLSGAGIGGGGGNTAAYTLILYHSLVLQGFLAGLVAGKMSNGSMRSGVKYSAAMVFISYIVMLALGA